MVSIKWAFNLDFQGFLKHPQSVYHLPWGDLLMGKWSDKFRSRFDSDSHQAQIATERAVQKHQLVQAQHGKLWIRLKHIAKLAVEEINESGDNDILDFMEPDDTFVISYVRSNETRTATARINRSTKTVLIELRNGQRQEYAIRANDNNEVEFYLNASYTPETIVEGMLAALL